MAKKAKYGSTKRYGTRYGRTLKEKVGKVEALQKKKYSCPSCNYLKVKRVSSGIWQCEKCNLKFTSKAYTVAKIPALKTGDQDGSV